MSKNQKHIEAARRLETYLLSEGIRLSHRKALEAVARVENERNWNLLSARAEAEEASASPAHASEASKSKLPAFDFLPQHYQVRRLLDLCVGLLAKSGTQGTPEYGQAIQQLREFENLSVWGDWTARELEQAVEGYRNDHGIDANQDIDEAPVRNALKSALYQYLDAHTATESAMSFLDTLVHNALNEHFDM